MILIITLALICAGTLAWALHPIMTGPHQRLGWRLLPGGAAAVLALYLFIGSPDTPSAPAIFETAGPRFEQRIAAQRELVILEALSGAPDHIPFLLELGTVRIQAGHPQDALEPLVKANNLSPNDPFILEALGAAHYAVALNYAMQPRKDAKKMALDHFEKAVKVTPEKAEFYARLLADQKAVQGAGLNTVGP